VIGVPGIVRLGPPLVHWYVVEEDSRLTIVDAGLPKFAQSLERELAGLGHGLDDVEAVVLTHSDSDHTGLAPTFKDAGARILIHEADEGTLRKPGPKGGDGSPIHLVPRMWRPRFWRFFGGMARAGGAKPPPVEDAETFSGGDVLDVPGRPRVVHTPGHTPGHCAFHFEEREALFVGDALCTWNPLTGRLGPQVMPKPFNVSVDACFDSLSAIEGVDAKVLLPGHGDPWHGSPAVAVARARAAGRS
jgi:glyoxylase-like metal-dependent hydrolase (beta-lactamase superfamily II)